MCKLNVNSTNSEDRNLVFKEFKSTNFSWLLFFILVFSLLKILILWLCNWQNCIGSYTSDTWSTCTISHKNATSIMQTSLDKYSDPLNIQARKIEYKRKIYPYQHCTLRSEPCFQMPLLCAFLSDEMFHQFFFGSWYLCID